MKIYKLLLAGLLLSGCNYIQSPTIPAPHINNVANQLSMISDTTLAVKLLATPPKGIGEVGLLKGDSVVYTAPVDSNAKSGDIIYLHYPFKNNVHYALHAVGQGMEYYNMSAYDFTLDIKTHSILGLRKMPLIVNQYQ